MSSIPAFKTDLLSAFFRNVHFSQLPQLDLNPETFSPQLPPYLIIKLVQREIILYEPPHEKTNNLHM